MVHAAPSYLRDIFQTYLTTLSYARRSSDINVLLPKPNTECIKGCFKFCGAKLWNELQPSEIKLENSLTSLKRKVLLLSRTQSNQ